jgi:chromosome segregation ATPase
MSERNGPDIGAVYQLLTEVARIVGAHDRRFDAMDHRFEAIEARLDEHTSKLNELIGTVNGHTRKLDELADIANRHQQRLADLTTSVADLRETLTHYHASVLGHGILLSELDERVRRIERHLRLDPASD